MRAERINQEPGVPEGNSAVRKSRATDLARKFSLQSTNLVLQILCLLTICPLRRVGSDRLDRIPNNLHFAFEAIADDGEIRRQGAVVVDKQDVGVSFGSVAADVLGDDFAADGTPHVVDAVGLTDFFGVV